MTQGIMTIRQRFSEHFSSTWKLLSETTSFLSKTSILEHYERELMEIRKRLVSHGNDRAVVTEIKNDVIEIRQSLRLNGYDLTLGDYRLIVDEYKNDAASDSYRRMVMFIGRDSLWIKTGEANHNTLFEYLESEKHGEILQVHFLWYRWKENTLLLSGSDSEEKKSFENLKKWSELPENKFLILRGMKREYR